MGPLEVRRYFQPLFDGSALLEGELEVFYWKTGPDNCKGKAEKKPIAKKKKKKKRQAGWREKERRRERKRKINERVCCDSCSNAAAIITIHQDNE